MDVDEAEEVAEKFDVSAMPVVSAPSALPAPVSPAGWLAWRRVCTPFGSVSIMVEFCGDCIAVQVLEAG